MLPGETTTRARSSAGNFHTSEEGGGFRFYSRKPSSQLFDGVFLSNTLSGRAAFGSNQTSIQPGSVSGQGGEGLRLMGEALKLCIINNKSLHFTTKTQELYQSAHNLPYCPETTFALIVNIRSVCRRSIWIHTPPTPRSVPRQHATWRTCHKHRSVCR